MTLQVTDLTTLDPQQVEQMRLAETQLLQEYNPGVSLEMGPLQDLVVTPKAALDTATQTNIQLVVQSSSLAQIVANPALADPTTVDNLLSNYGLTAEPAVAATGPVTIVISSLIPTVIPASLIFTISGQTFQPQQTYSARVSSALVQTSTDVLITPLGSNFQFAVPVQAVTAGAAGNITIGSPATLSQNPAQLVSAYASADFTGGADAQTTSSLIAELQAGLAAKAWGNRATASAQLSHQFQSLLADSIIGFGDPEMQRDTHSIWPGHTGGRVDVWIRTAQSPQSVLIGKTATLVSISGNQGTWRFTIGRDDAPGFYEVTKILAGTMQLTAAGFAPLTDVRSFDLTPDATHTYFPDIVNFIEAAYSRYQTATITFVDTVTNASGLPVGTATANYQVVVSLMPQTDVIQDYLGEDANRPPMSDVLVRGAVPCFTSISMTLGVTAGATLTAAAVQTAVAAAVNAQEFGGTLSSSLISQVLHNLGGSSLLAVTGLALAGRIRRPDGGNVYIADPVQLAIPNSPLQSSTANTALFLLSPADVAVTIVTVSS